MPRPTGPRSSRSSSPPASSGPRPPASSACRPGAVRPIRRGGAGPAGRPGHAPRRGPQDRQRRPRQRLRRARNHGGHALRPPVAAGSAGRTQDDPVKIEHEVGGLVPKSEWTMLSHRLIWHGRRVCHARKPACGACGVAALCPSFGTGPDRPGRGRQARQDRAVLLTADGTAAAAGTGSAELARGRRLTCRCQPPLRPPADGGGRPAAVLILFGDGAAGPTCC